MGKFGKGVFGGVACFLRMDACGCPHLGVSLSDLQGKMHRVRAVSDTDSEDRLNARGVCISKDLIEVVVAIQVAVGVD
jgi:hypothetical protein